VSKVYGYKAEQRSCRAAFDPSMKDHNGAYMTDCAVDEGSCRDHARDMVRKIILGSLEADNQGEVRRIWGWSEDLIKGTGQTL
jgi:hypothetical protein